MRKLLLCLLLAAGSAFAAERDAMRDEARAIERGHGYMVAALRGITGSGGSGTISAGTVGQCAVYTGTTTLGGTDCATLTGTPAAGDISYWTSATAQALLTAASGSTGAYLRSAGTGAAPIWSTLILPNAATSGGVLYGSAANTVSSSGALTANAFLTGGGAGAAPNSVAITGLVYGNGASAPAAVATNQQQAATSSLATDYIIYKQGLPMIYLSSGTATGSPSGTGAVTGLTALTAVNPLHAYCYMPAGANVDGSSTAGWYYCTFSAGTGATTATIYNNRYTPSSTPPTIPGSPTAPTTLTTWTSDTGAVNAISFSIPAGAMGANGMLETGQIFFATTNNANAKSWSISFGGTTVVNAFTLASGSQDWGYSKISNTGSTAVQYTNSIRSSGTVGTATTSTVDTTGAVTVILSVSKATATDNLGIQPIVFRLFSNGS